MTEVIEFAPFLKRKQASECKHETYLVSMTTASLTCEDCDAELDPWWVLRSLVQRSEEEEAIRQASFLEWDAKCREAMAKHEAWVRNANDQIQKLTADKNRLMAEKLRLANDPEIARGRASRRAKGSRP